MISDEDAYSHSLAEKLSFYRPHMQTLFVNWSATENRDAALASHLVLRKVQEILEPNSAALERHAGAA